MLEPANDEHALTVEQRKARNRAMYGPTPEEENRRRVVRLWMSGVVAAIVVCVAGLVYALLTGKPLL